MAYLSGDVVYFDVYFTDTVTGNPVDPSGGVSFYNVFNTTTSATITYVSATSSSVGVIAKIVAGHYQTQVALPAGSGQLTGYWTGTGTGAATFNESIQVGSTTGGGMVFGDLIENVFRRIVGPVQEIAVTINQTNPIGSGDTTFTIAGPQTAAVVPGTKLSIDLEDMFVLSKSTLTVTVVRGFNGSTPATHLTSALVYVNSRVTRFDISVALNDDLNDLSAQGLFRVGTAQLTYNSVFQGYDLGGLPTNYTAILGVEYRTISPSRRFPTITDFDIRRWNTGVTDSAFPSGNALILYEAAQPGQPFYVTYSAPFLPLVNVTDSVTSTPVINDQAPPPNGYTSTTVPNLALTMLDIPPLGATAALIQPQEITRDALGIQSSTRNEEEVPAQAVATSTNPLLARRAMRISAEANRLYVAYPNRR